jgi:hypothetical protein
MVYGRTVEKTTLYLPADLQRALREASRRTGRPQAELIRQALYGYLEHERRPRPRSIGLGDAPDVSGRDAEAWLEREWDED